MGKEVRTVIALIFALMFIVIFSSMAFAVGENIASVSLNQKGIDLECEVEYDLAVAEKKPSFQWINQNGIMNVPNQAILEREHFSRGDTIICKYGDIANGISIQDKLRVVNTPPTLNKIDDKIITQGNILQLNPTANDVDGDVVTFSYAYPLNEDGRWSDTIDFRPGDYEVVVTADDGNGGTDTQVVRINLLDRFGDQKENVERRKQESSELLKEVITLREGRANKQFVNVKANQLAIFQINNENIPFQEITFSLPKDEVNVDLEVQVLLEKPRNIPAAEDENEIVLDYIQIRHSGVENINAGNFKFRISKQELYEMRVPSHAIKMKRLVKDTWVDLKTRGIGSDEMYQIYNSETPGFSYFAIVGTKTISEGPLIEVPIIDDQVIEIEREADDAKLIEVVDETATFENWTALLVALIIALVVGAFVVVFVLTQKNDQKLIGELEDAEHVENFEDAKISEEEALRNEVNTNVQNAKELISEGRLREARQIIKKLQELSRKLEGADREVVNSNILKLRKLMMKVIEESM